MRLSATSGDWCNMVDAVVYTHFLLNAFTEVTDPPPILPSFVDAYDVYLDAEASVTYWLAHCLKELTPVQISASNLRSFGISATSFWLVRHSLLEMCSGWLCAA